LPKDLLARPKALRTGGTVIGSGAGGMEIARLPTAMARRRPG